MCDRFSLALSKVKVTRRFGVKIQQAPEISYNISPGTLIPVIINNLPDQVIMARWGMEVEGVNKKRKSKLIHSLPASTWQQPKQVASLQLIQTQRCLIPADGFYIWKKVSRKGKVPYRIVLKWNLPFAFAGIWQSENQAPNSAYSCAILTTDANDELRSLHGMMPVILPIESESIWLNQNLSLEAILRMLKPYPGDQMNFFPVTTKINSLEFNSPLLQEAAQPTDQFGNYMLFDK